jgi:hypothetical protein
MIVEYGIAVIIAALYSFTCLSFGAALIRLLAGRRGVLIAWEPLTATGSAFLLGQGILAAVWVLVTTAGLFRIEIILPVTGLALIVGARPAASLLVNLSRRLRDALKAVRTDSPGWRLVAWGTLALIAMIGVSTLLPPQPRGDALAFYLTMPRLISDTHHLLAPPGYETFTKIGLQGELHYAALMTLGNTFAAKLFVWPVSLAGGLLLLGLGHEAGLGRHAKWTTLAALFTSTAFTAVIWNGKVDVFGGAMGLAALYWALYIAGEERRLALSLTGLFAGLAVIAKLSNLLALAPGAALIILWQWAAYHSSGTHFKRPALWDLARSLLIVGAWAGVALVPHIIKSAVLYGEPLAPFIGQGTAVITDQVWFSPETTQRILLTYPLALVYGRFWAQGGYLTPLLVAFAPLLLLLPRPHTLLHSKLFAIALAGLVGVIAWMAIRPSILAPRYIFPSLLVLILPVARAAEYVCEPSRSRRKMVAAAIVPAILITLLIGAQPFWAKDSNVYKLATDQITECALEVGVSDASCRVAKILGQIASPGERVFMASYYTYWLRSDLLQCADIKLPGTQSSIEARWESLIEQGYTYIIIDQLTHGEIVDQLALADPPDWINLELLYDGQQDIDDNPFLAYRFSSRASSYQAQIACTKIDSSRWQPAPITVLDSAPRP